MTIRHFRPMTLADIDTVVALITETDEEDGEAASIDFARVGVDGHVVMSLGDDEALVGLSGFRHIPATERTSSLSWTCLARAHRGHGHGSALVDHVVSQLRALGCRKVFAKVSDYEAPQDGAHYAVIRKVLERLDFVRELTALDFYDAGENLVIHGLTLIADDGTEAPDIAAEKPAIAFVGLHEIADTDGAFTFEWAAPRRSLFDRRRTFEHTDLVVGLEGVRRAGGRKVFLTFPSNLPAISEPLRAAGFQHVGRLQDYYERGLHELHFSHDLSGIV